MGLPTYPYFARSAHETTAEKAAPHFSRRVTKATEAARISGTEGAVAVRCGEAAVSCGEAAERGAGGPPREKHVATGEVVYYMYVRGVLWRISPELVGFFQGLAQLAQ